MNILRANNCERSRGMRFGLALRTMSHLCRRGYVGLTTQGNWPDGNPDCANPGEASEHGFTLVEMLVVLLIIGIVLAIAIPTFLGARTSDQDTIAQSTIDTSMTAARQQAQHYSNYSHVFPQDLAPLVPDIHFVPYNVSSSGPNHVSVNVAGCPDDTVPPAGIATCRNNPTLNTYGNNDTVLVLAAWSNTGVCWFEMSITSPFVNARYGEAQTGTYYAAVPESSSSCQAGANHAPASASQWHRSWVDAAGTLSAGQ